jgi:beta-glucosidase
LKSFVKVELSPGESKTISLHLDREAFWYYNPADGGWNVEAGDFEILIGSSSRDLRLRAVATLLPKDIVGSRLNIGLPLRAILSDETGKAVLTEHFGELMVSPDLEMALDLTVEQIARLLPQILTPEKLIALSNDLAKA